MIALPLLRAATCLAVVAPVVAQLPAAVDISDLAGIEHITFHYDAVQANIGYHVRAAGDLTRMDDRTF